MVVGVERPPTGLGPDSYVAQAQQEFNFRLEKGSWYFRFDMDVQFASSEIIKPLAGYWSAPPWAEIEPRFKIGPPEWAMLQYSLDHFRFRGGIVTSMIGLEDWDPWINSFPTRGLNYNLTPGRTVGAEVAYVTDGGHEFTVFGGCDVDWADCIAQDIDDDGIDDITPWMGMKVGAGWTTVQERYASWSGITAYPNLNIYLANLNMEFYVHEYLWVDVEAAPILVGVPDAEDNLTYNPAIVGGLSFIVLPNEPIHPMFRVHGNVDPDDKALALFYPAYEGNLAEVVASAGVSIKPNDFFKMTFEGKYQHYSFGDVAGFYTGMVFWKPEPPPYSAKYPEAPPAEARRGQPNRNVASATRVRW